MRERDLQIMLILEKIEIARAYQLAILAGYRDLTVCRKRINRLLNEGYIISYHYDGANIYTLTQKGLSSVDKRRRAWSATGSASEHGLAVTEAACWLCIEEEISAFDMRFDHELRGRSEGHIPDIVFGDKCIEVERSIKKISRLDTNIRENDMNYASQVWIVPRRLVGLKKNICNILGKIQAPGVVYDLEEIKNEVAGFSLKTNRINMLFQPTHHQDDTGYNEVSSMWEALQ